ncbi:MAG: DUF72 domain-containing protein [Pseudomonadota bacterium]
MELLEGTSGYSYKEWVGTFYPEKTKPAAMLECYAQALPAVEINNTFYRLPKRDVLARWAAQVPEHFRFFIKASRRITHLKRLVEAEEETRYLLDTVSVLEQRLGGILFQLPPFLRLDLQRLQAFQALLPGELSITFEFRHPSWHCEETVRALAQAGHALCVSHTAPDPDQEEDDARKNPEELLIATAKHAYLRLRAVTYTDQELAQWLAHLRALQVERAYVFFKHEDEATGPALAKRLRTLHEGQA